MHTKDTRRGHSEEGRFSLSDPQTNDGQEIRLDTSRVEVIKKNATFWKRLNYIIAETYGLEEHRKCNECRSILIIEHKTSYIEKEEEKVYYTNTVPAGSSNANYYIEKTRKVNRVTWVCGHCMHQIYMDDPGPWKKKSINIITADGTILNNITFSNTKTFSSTTDKVYLTGNVVDPNFMKIGTDDK